MKFLTYIFTLAYLLTASTSFATKSNESRIAAVVNDKSILLSDLDHRLNLLLKTTRMETTPEMRKNLRERILQQMIDEELQRQLAKKFEIEIEKNDLEAAWSSMEKRLEMAPGQLKEHLKTNKIPKRVVTDQLQATLEWQHYIHERYRNFIQVTKEDVKTEMDRIKADKDRDQALLSEIVLTYDSPEQAEQTRQKASRLITKMQAGTPFPLLAQQFSNSGSAATGGDIGWVCVDQLEGPLKEKISLMKQGEVSEPIDVGGSYRIIGVRDRHGVGSLGDPIEYVSFQHIEFMFPMFGGQPAMEQTFINATQVRNEGRSCSLMKKMTTDRPRIKNQIVERRRIDELHPELAKVLKRLKPGERSELMNTGQGFVMFMLCNREVVQPHEPTEDDVRNSLSEKKISLIADRELRNLRRAAFVDKRS